MPTSYETSNSKYKVVIPATQSQILSMNQQIVPDKYQVYTLPKEDDGTINIDSNTSTEETQEQAEGQEPQAPEQQVPDEFLSYAPLRNFHYFSVMSDDENNDFYFSPNYSYNRESFVEYQQVVVERVPGSTAGVSELYWEDIENEDDENENQGN